MCIFINMKVYCVFSLEAILMSTHNIPAETRIYIVLAQVCKLVLSFEMYILTFWKKRKENVLPELCN